MRTFYSAYLKDNTLDPLNNCVGSTTFHVDDPDVAELIAQARFAEELKDPNKFVEIDPYEPVEPKIFIDEDDEE